MGDLYDSYRLIYSFADNFSLIIGQFSCPTVGVVRLGDVHRIFLLLHHTHCPYFIKGILICLENPIVDNFFMSFEHVTVRAVDRNIQYLTKL